MAELIYADECYKIIGACFEVYRRKGCGFTEALYQECLAIELEFHDIPFEAQRPLILSYREQVLKQRFIPDFVCFDKIILEIKAVSTLIDEHRSQMMNYLNATGFKLGLLVNFGHYPKVQYQRLVNTKEPAKRAK